MHKGRQSHRMNLILWQVQFFGNPAGNIGNPFFMTGGIGMRDAPSLRQWRQSHSQVLPETGPGLPYSQSSSLRRRALYPHALDGKAQTFRQSLKHLNCHRCEGINLAGIDHQCGFIMLHRKGDGD